MEISKIKSLGKKHPDLVRQPGSPSLANQNANAVFTANQMQAAICSIVISYTPTSDW